MDLDRMWYALTAQTVKRSKKEKRREFLVQKEEIILSAESREQLENKLKKTRSEYPEQIEKYLQAGIKIIEAKNPAAAKRRANEVPVSIEKSGQLKLFWYTTHAVFQLQGKRGEPINNGRDT